MEMTTTPNPHHACRYITISPTTTTTTNSGSLATNDAQVDRRFFLAKYVRIYAPLFCLLILF
jgi:hypothetical protein